jgi:prepilin-type N-terminal cleavage/methylation domain-containing protein
MKTAPGFTLLELVMVMAILAMVIIGAQAVGSRLGRQGVGLAVDQLRADIQLARLMAIKSKRQCALVFHSPRREQYRNAITGQWKSLEYFQGGVHFLSQGPDGKPAASRIIFNRRGMSTSPMPKEVFLTDADGRNIIRVRVLLPGGISVHRWGNDRWY